MPDDSDRGSFAADIPADAIAEALAAVTNDESARARAGDPGPTAEANAGDPGPTADGPPPAEGGGRVGEGAEERLRAELEMSQERSRKLYEQLREEHDLRLRAAADLENYRKRAAREKEEVLRYGNERLLKEILPVLDNLDRALAAAGGDDPLRTGVSMTRRLLEEALGRFGVKGFSAVGGAFDPRLHEALMTVASADHPPATVLSEQQRGFFLHDRLIRPAAVVVSVAPAPAAAGAPGSPGEREDADVGAGE
jgi:molecular chaperone GrpE